MDNQLSEELDKILSKGIEVEDVSVLDHVLLVTIGIGSFFIATIWYLLY